MPVSRIAIGDLGEASHPEALKAAFAEFISMIIFVFAGQGSGMALTKITDGGIPEPASGLIVAALAHTFAIIVAVSVAANISGGHVNPAVTFGAFVSGNITLLRAILYWVAQLLGSVVASNLILWNIMQEAAAFSLSEDVTVKHALVFEIIMTFGLVYTVFATAIDPRKGNLAVIAPIAIGLIVGANILVGGAFEGASMNPAVSFGPAVVSWTWKNHWIYWVGPMLGAALAAMVYDTFFISDSGHEQLPTQRRSSS